MSTKPNIENILNSLEGIKRAEPGPFFTGRVMQRIQTPRRIDVITSWPRLAWAFSVVATLIVLNLILFFTQLRSDDRTISEWKSTTPEWVIDYTQNPGSTYYDISHK